MNELHISIGLASSGGGAGAQDIGHVPLGGPRRPVRQPLGPGVQRALRPLLEPLQGCAREQKCRLQLWFNEVKVDDGEAFFFLNEGRAERREKCDKVGTDNRFLWGKGKKEVLEEGNVYNIYIYNIYFISVCRVGPFEFFR